MIIHKEIKTKGSAEQIFALAQDYDLKLKWDPFLKKMSFLDDATEAARVNSSKRNFL